MREYSKKLIFLLCGILIVLTVFVQKGYAGVDKKIKKNKTILVIGDSIAYGMAQEDKSDTGVDNGEDVYWLAEGGINITWIRSDFKISLGRVMPKNIVNTFTTKSKFDLLKEIKKKKVEDIVVVLGTNCPGGKFAKLVVTTLKNMAKKSGCRVYYVNHLPYVNKGRYKNRFSVVAKHNEITRKGFKGTDITYIDAYKIVKSIKNYHTLTEDGIHYSKKAYNKVFKAVLDSIKERREEQKE